MEKLGKGSTCLVYRAVKKDFTDKTDYAIKVMKLNKSTCIDQIKTEIAMMNTSLHPNILTYFDTYKYMKLLPIIKKA